MTKLKVLWLPAWFPCDRDPQLGNFTFQQAEAICEKVDLTILTYQKKYTGSDSISLNWIDYSSKYKLFRFLAMSRWFLYIF